MPLGVAGSTEWIAGDATALLTSGFDVPSAHPSPTGGPDLVIVNPPRRGIGPALAGRLESSGVRDVIYSSCNADSLARDLAGMPSLRPVSARLLDMFPHTNHHEVLLHLTRS